MCARCPTGTSVPHMFVVTFVVMLPILAKTSDPVQAWEAGLTWVFVQQATHRWPSRATPPPGTRQ